MGGVGKTTKRGREDECQLLGCNRVTCKWLELTANLDHSYHLNNQPVKIATNQVDLGVVVSNDPKMSPHIACVLLKPTVCLVFFAEIVLKWLILAAVDLSISHSSDLTCLTPVRSGHLNPRDAILRSWKVFRDELLNLYFKIMSCLVLSVLGNLIYYLYLMGLKCWISSFFSNPNKASAA
jgi:hypothetical protein